MEWRDGWGIGIVILPLSWKKEKRRVIVGGNVLHRLESFSFFFVKFFLLL